tara:strand:- start:74 stop:442 length:369 start_codon:yes stop_codon:yes gene_type:complete
MSNITIYTIYLFVKKILKKIILNKFFIILKIILSGIFSVFKFFILNKLFAVLLVFAIWAWVMFNILIPMSGVDLFEETEYWKNYNESYYKENLRNKVCNVKIIDNKCCKNNKEKTNPKKSAD